MSRCPLDGEADHEFAFEDGGEAYCAEHGIRALSLIEPDPVAVE